MSEHYERLRALSSPVVAITTTRGGELNGLIVNSALRASLSPEKMRISVIIHKFNYSHDMIFESGVFAAHMLRPDQIGIVLSLGCSSGRDGDKMAGLGYDMGETGAPLLRDCLGYYDCRVVNAMDTGGSTVFLGAVQAAGGDGAGEVMTTAHVRAGIPASYDARYKADLERGQQFATKMADEMRPIVWRGLAGS
jgi:flavin reductase (DIM6/NTAB) family NADH-FMN oxidoreductase RutF